MMGPFQHRLIEWVINSKPDMPAESRDMLERASSGGRGGVAFKLVLSW